MALDAHQRIGQVQLASDDAQLLESSILNLANPLLRNRQSLAHLAQGKPRLTAQPKAKRQDFLLPRPKRLHQLADRLVSINIVSMVSIRVAHHLHQTELSFRVVTGIQ